MHRDGVYGDDASNTVVHRRVLQWSTRTPDSVALEFGDRRFVYADLATAACRIAAGLRRQGVGPDVPVGVHLPRSERLVIAHLAVLAAGGAYLTLDPAQPDKALADQIAIASVPVVITDRASRDRLPSTVRTLLFDDLVDHPAEPLPDSVGPDHFACIMFTSGSTGKPKAVAIPHRAVVNLVTAQNYMTVGPEQCYLLHTAPTFDPSIFETWGALLNGGRLAIAPPGAPSVGELARLVREHGATATFLTPTMFRLILEEQPHALHPLRDLLLGGEAIFPAHLELAAQHLPDTSIIVGYGPTESTVLVTAHVQTSADPLPPVVVIGHDITGVRTYILDEDLNPVPDGEPGELCIAGAGLACGYLGAPDLTAERFAPDPHASRPGDRLYRTGDRVRAIGYGGMEFLGRLDNQLKIRGRRIEPGEVEQALVHHADVLTAYVTAEQNDRRGKYLAAYVTLRTGSTSDESDLRSHMASAVADHLRPDVYVLRTEASVTANGKLDRRRLIDGAAAPTKPSAGPTLRTVVVNDDDQYAIWPAHRPAPTGWTSVDLPGTVDECKTLVRRLWSDIRPARRRHAVQTS
ncbi:amino acid adenylation domain-containing protein [Nocardia vinacea]|uniref:amino acid adenylation domain-containing protein n=1 Tax=Nocardia vinacea TaxID=96468 RepID=UPI002E13AC56|nr:amino acid adenylation domain-containing protein [Nocardia vinacea]